MLVLKEAPPEGYGSVQMEALLTDLDGLCAGSKVWKVGDQEDRALYGPGVKGQQCSPYCIVSNAR